MIGVDVPSPGMWTFQEMFLLSSHFTGGLPLGATPVPSGPRHCGQLSAAGDAEAHAAAKMKKPIEAAIEGRRNLTADVSWW
jgi:hypothetical protein